MTSALMKDKQLVLFCKIFAYGHTLFPLNRELQRSWDTLPLPMYFEFVNSLLQLQQDLE